MGPALTALWLILCVSVILRMATGQWPLRPALEYLSPPLRRQRAAQRRRQGIRAELRRYAYPAGWVQALPADVGAAITGWPGADGDAARAFLCRHWRLTYDLDGLVDLRPLTCNKCGRLEGEGDHHALCPDRPQPPCLLCRDRGGRHAGWCHPDGAGGRIARGVYRDSIRHVSPHLELSVIHHDARTRRGWY